MASSTPVVVANNASLPYHEPRIVELLVLTSFLLLLNVTRSVLDRLLFCGLLAQILVGMAWGAPGAKWLEPHAQEFIVQLGYLGLVLLVYEGGLSTSITSLRANLFLSILVALTGICVPIALSFILKALAGASNLQAFAAGAALCSTSLGTTFTVLSTSGFTNTRLGVVLSTAAMMDDVVGLVMVQVISGIGASRAVNAATIVRPALVSLAFSIIVPVLCNIAIRPIAFRINAWRTSHPDAKLNAILIRRQTVFLVHMVFLIATVTAAAYAGTSALFAAYIAGAFISWWDAELAHNNRSPQRIKTPKDENLTHAKVGTALPDAAPTISSNSNDDHSVHSKPSDLSGRFIYNHYIHPLANCTLIPFFFASIGFSIPICELFRGSIVWRGMVYTSLMIIGKLACGLWLVRISLSARFPRLARRLQELGIPTTLPSCTGVTREKTRISPSNKATTTSQGTSAIISPAIPLSPLNAHVNTGDSESAQSAEIEPITQQIQIRRKNTLVPTPPASIDPKKPVSLYPAAILANAMVARGEIGFLISAVAEGSGILSAEQFLIVTWAIILCTLVGPVAVGLLVRRVKSLEARAPHIRAQVLGAWGVQ